jgi:hypothetical protein
MYDPNAAFSMSCYHYYFVPFLFTQFHSSQRTITSHILARSRAERVGSVSSPLL